MKSIESNSYRIKTRKQKVKLEPTTKAFIEKVNAGPPLNTLTPQKARAVISELQASYPVQKLPADIVNRTIPGGPNATEVSITIVRPPNRQQ